MRVAEARWIANQFAALRPEQRATVVNIGSSTLAFRTQNQPHIDQLIFAPLAAAGSKIIHADLKAAPGVDIAGDLADARVRAQLAALQPNVVLCSNLLEHVADPQQFATYIRDLVPPGGKLIVTAPREYPYHADPIDNGYRPTPEQLARVFANTSIRVAQVVADTTYLQELRRKGLAGVKHGVSTFLGAIMNNGDLRRAKRERLGHLLTPFTTSCVVLDADV